MARCYAHNYKKCFFFVSCFFITLNDHVNANDKNAVGFLFKNVFFNTYSKLYFKLLLFCIWSKDFFSVLKKLMLLDLLRKKQYYNHANNLILY